MCVTVRVPNTTETPLSEIVAGPARIRYAYCRSWDARAGRQPGQDWLAFRYSPERAVFALCDGVGQSFFGELAAEFVAERCLEYLWERPRHELVAPEFALRLEGWLVELMPELTGPVQAHPIPPVNEALSEVLQELREFPGSETMLLAGRVDFNGPARLATLVSMGDSRLYVVAPGGELLLESVKDDSVRLSSHRGVIGRPDVSVEPFQGSLRVLAYSDGLQSLDSRVAGRLSDGDLDRLVTTAREQRGSDDISLFECDLS